MPISRLCDPALAGQPDVVEVDRKTWNLKAPLYMQTTHRGLVLGTYERNGYDDSDFIAVVWNPNAGKPEDIEYASTRGWSYPCHAEIDAPPGIMAAYQDYLNEERDRQTRLLQAREASIPKVGKHVKVVRGRKVPLGTEGIIFWMKDQYFSPRFRNGYRRNGPDSIKIGIALDETRDARGRYANVVWTYAANVEVLHA
jgi:hypothetical protein